MVCNDLIRRLSLFKERPDYGSYIFSFLNSKIHSLTRINKSGLIISLRAFWRILVFIKSTVVPIGTTVASTWRAVSSGTTEWGILGTIRGAFAFKNASAIVITFERHRAFMCQNTMKLDFFSNSRLVFANSLCNGSFG